MSKGIKIIFWILGILLLASVITMAVLLGVFVKRNGESENRVNALYEKSYYEVVDSLKNVETKLTKVNVVNGEKVKRELLADVWKECDIAVINFAQLGIDGEETEKVVKFLNQVGDYCYYLTGKASAGEEMTATEKGNIRKFKEMIASLRNDLADIGNNMSDGQKISAKTLSDLTAVKDAIKSYSSIDYPELIYDGPFSDGLNDKETKFLNDKELVTEEEAKAKIRAIFGEDVDARKIGDGSLPIETFIFSFTQNDMEYTVFVTKKGGYISTVNTFTETSEPTLDTENCVQKAKDFLFKCGYLSMKDVWVYNNNSTVYVNFAYEKDGVVYYPDMIKVKVSANDGKILGLEASGYLYNHCQRDIDFNAYSQTEITVNSEITVKNQRYCIIPTEWNEEVFCKEICGEYDGNTYYVYYDMKDGKEMRALVVIDEDGDKLI